MSLLSELLAFAGIMALGQFSPGPDMVLLTRTALTRGAWQGVLMAAGIATGLMFHASIAALGVSTLLMSGGWFALTLRVLAAVYLAFLAWRIWPRGDVSNGQADPDTGGHPYLRGLYCNLLNSKAALFFGAVMAPFLGASDAAWWPWLLAGVAVFEGALLWALWALLLQRGWIRCAYAKMAVWIDRFFSIALVLMAASLFFWL